MAVRRRLRRRSRGRGSAALDTCTAADRNGTGAVTIDELLGAVNAALNGC